MVNAISHVCLSGTVNQDQKEKCLQVCAENGVYVPRKAANNSLSSDNCPLKSRF